MTVFRMKKTGAKHVRERGEPICIHTLPIPISKSLQTLGPHNGYIFLYFNHMPSLNGPFPLPINNSHSSPTFIPTANIPLPSSSSSFSIMAAPASAAAVAPTVQHVAKKSSDQLLQKFAQLDSPSPKFKSKRRISIAESHCRSPPHAGSALIERRSLLPPAAARRSTLLRQLGIARSRLKARDIRNRSLFGTLEKTWRSTIEGASRVFMEKHYHRHKRLINDIV